MYLAGSTNKTVTIPYTIPRPTTMSRLIRHHRRHSIASFSSAILTTEFSTVNRSHSTLPSISPVNTSLALSVHFRHPSLGMRDYEILSRATAFLLQVDPPEPNEKERTTIDHATKSRDAGNKTTTIFPHLRENIELRKKLLLKQDYKFDPATGPPRLPHQLNWLEFCPAAFRPKVHVVASSHVISPWMWPKYYNQEWLRTITQEHVRYSLEVWGVDSTPDNQEEEKSIAHDGKLRGNHCPLAKFALNPYPIHHPKEMDLAVIHLKDEDEALRLMQKMGITPLHLPTMHELEMNDDPVFERGEQLLVCFLNCNNFNLFLHKSDFLTSLSALVSGI